MLEKLNYIKICLRKVRKMDDAFVVLPDKHPLFYKGLANRKKCGIGFLTTSRTASDSRRITSLAKTWVLTPVESITVS